MAILDIPTGPEAFRKQRVILDQVNYILVFAYNQRGNYWTLDVNDENDNPIIQGVKIVSNYPLLKQYSEVGLPPGTLMSISQTTDDSPAGYQDLGTGSQRCVFVYYDQAEVASAAAGTL